MHTEIQKFTTLVTFLPKSLLGYAENALIEDSQKPYSLVKTMLLEKFSLSIEERINKLVSQPILIGDRTPSEFYTYLAQEAKAVGFNDNWVRCAWLHQMPLNVRLNFIASDETLEDFVSMANLMVKKSNPDSSTRCAKMDREPQYSRLPGSNLNTEKISNVASVRNHRDNSKYCWYHNSFGAKAKKCKAPCYFAALN